MALRPFSFSCARCRSSLRQVRQRSLSNVTTHHARLSRISSSRVRLSASSMQCGKSLWPCGDVQVCMPGPPAHQPAPHTRVLRSPVHSLGLGFRCRRLRTVLATCSRTTHSFGALLGWNIWLLLAVLRRRCFQFLTTWWYPSCRCHRRGRAHSTLFSASLQDAKW